MMMIIIIIILITIIIIIIIIIIITATTVPDPCPPTEALMEEVQLESEDEHQGTTTRRARSRTWRRCRPSCAGWASARPLQKYRLYHHREGRPAVGFGDKASRRLIGPEPV
jgi:hypothetical protein